MSKLIELYTSILRAAGMVSDSDGFVSLNNQLYNGTPNSQALIGGKRIVLPTDYQLRNPSPNVIFFHPLREQAQRGESETVAKLRNVIGIRLNFTFQAVMNEMIELAKNRGRHKTLDPDQAVALMSVKDVTDGTHVAFTELVQRADMDDGKPWISIYVKKSAVVGDRNYFRAGIVSFPMYKEIKEAEKPLGFAISEKERVNILRLMEYILPGIDTEHSYDRGSNSGVAPHMDALMKAFDAVASRLNQHVDTFHDVFSHKGLRIDSEWVEGMQDLEAMQPYIQMVPQQPGNEGALPGSVVVPAQAQAAPAQPTTPGGAVSFDALMQRAPAAHPQMPQQPMYMPPVNPYPHLQNYPGMPQMVPGVGMVPQHVMQQHMQQMQQQHQPPGAPRGSWAMPGINAPHPQSGGRPGMMMPGGVWVNFA